MRITERKLRDLIRNIIRETNWRDTLPGGATWDYRHPEGEAYKIDHKRAKDLAYSRQHRDQGSSKEHYPAALSKKFYKENDIDLSDAYYIAQTYLDLDRENFCISDFDSVSDDGKVFLKHYFHIDDDHSREIKRDDLEDLIFSPEKLGMDPGEF